MTKETWYEIHESIGKVFLYYKSSIGDSLVAQRYSYVERNLSEVIQARIELGPDACFPEITECLKIARDELIDRGILKE